MRPNGLDLVLQIVGLFFLCGTHKKLFDFRIDLTDPIVEGYHFQSVYIFLSEPNHQLLQLLLVFLHGLLDMAALD
jgi:hypothetical protein